MATKEFNPWQLSSGLPESFTGKVQDSFYAFDDNYQDGEAALLKWEVLADDPEIGESGVLTLMYPVGKGWEPKSKGAGVAHESGKAKNINRSSGLGLLIAALLEVCGEEIVDKGNPLDDAGIFKGMSFDFERRDFEANIGGEKITYNRMLPVAVAEGGGGEVKASKKSAKKSSKKDDAEDNGADGEGGDAAEVKLPAKVRIALKKLAKECDNHDEFVERAFEEIDGVEGDDAVEAAVMDSSDAGIWASEQ